MSQDKLFYFANRAPTISLINARMRMSLVLRHARHSRLNYPNLYSHRRIHSSRKISKRHYSFILSWNIKIPLPSALCSLRVHFFCFRVKPLAFFSTVIVGYYSYYLSKRAPSWGHSELRITYISPRISVGVPEFEPSRTPQNNSQEW